MEVLALLFFAIASPQAGEPVTWYFNLPSCDACRERQVRLMELYFKEGDFVVINGEKGRSQLEQKITEVVGTFKSSKSDTCLNGTGFIWEDKSTGESLSYNSQKGMYNLLRARVILDTFRDQN